MFIYILRERERQTASGGGAERARERQTRKQAPGSELPAQSPIQGLNPPTVRSWPEPTSDEQPTEPTRCPWFFVCFVFFFLHMEKVKFRSFMKLSQVIQQRVKASFADSKASSHYVTQCCFTGEEWSRHTTLHFLSWQILTELFLKNV